LGNCFFHYVNYFLERILLNVVAIICASDSFLTMALYKSIYLLTLLITNERNMICLTRYVSS